MTVKRDVARLARVVRRRTRRVAGQADDGEDGAAVFEGDGGEDVGVAVAPQRDV